VIAPPDSLVWERMLRMETVYRLADGAAQEERRPQHLMQGLTGRREQGRQGWPRYWDPRD
jgi:hypothetical protein